MLHQLVSHLQQKVKRVIGFRLARELDDVGKEIMAEFGVNDFHRDYEDTWEWVEGKSAEKLAVNISRPHTRTAGDYSVPIVVHVRGPASRLTDELIQGYARRLARSLQTEVWLGSVVPGKRERDYDFDVEQVFAPTD